MFLNKKRLAATVVSSALLGGILSLVGLSYLVGFNAQNFSDIARFLGVRKFIESRYVGDVDDSKLMDGAINGMVESLGDPHSIYMDPTMYSRLIEQTASSFGGIGVYMGFKDNKVSIISVIDGTPSASAGLQAGDEIVAVDGTPTAEMQPEAVALHIRGEVGTPVKLTIRRDGAGDQDYEIMRSTIQVKTVLGSLLPGNMGYIRISNFAENTGTEFRDALADLEAQGMAGLIIDLRENPGGLIKSCVEVADLVVPQGPIVSVVDKGGTKEEYDSDLPASKYPIVVLIDGNSASASEILAGALQDTGAATIVGTQSYGKGSVQVVVPMYHSDAIKLTIAKYYTPKGRSIDGTGITPDIEADLPRGATEDTQLAKAEEILAAKIGD